MINKNIMLIYETIIHQVIRVNNIFNNLLNYFRIVYEYTPCAPWLIFLDANRNVTRVHGSTIGIILKIHGSKLQLL